MGGCCLAALVMLIGPRLFLIGAWLLTDWYGSFESWLLALFGWLFLPYTSLAWMYIYFNNEGHIQGGYLILFILAVLLDIGVFSGSGKAAKDR